MLKFDLEIITTDNFKISRKSDGYHVISFKKDGNGYRNMLHRYAWEFYFGSIPKGYHIHHKDGDKENNLIINLELLTTTQHGQKHVRTGWHHTEETKEKLRILHIGKKHTEETKEKLRQDNLKNPRRHWKDKTFSDEHKRKLSESHIGQKRSAESIEKMRQKNIGQKRSAEQRARMSASAKGKKMSDEAKARISAAQKGRVLSDEHKAKISAAAKRRALSKK